MSEHYTGLGAHFPFRSPEEKSSLSHFSQSQMNVTDERLKANNKKIASKNKNSAL